MFVCVLTFASVHRASVSTKDLQGSASERDVCSGEVRVFYSVFVCACV